MTDQTRSANRPSPGGSDDFIQRHIGPRPEDVEAMLSTLELSSLDELAAKTVPKAILRAEPLNLDPASSEREALARLRETMAVNQVFKSFIGMGYHAAVTPPVIQRNVLENPGWYTQYTPYQPEISQGRLEAMLNFQTMICDLTGMEIANASMLDEGTAAAEAMTLSFDAHTTSESRAFFISRDCHPQTIEVIEGRAWPLGFDVIIGDHQTYDFARPVFGALLQYPRTDGVIDDYTDFCKRAHARGVLVTVAADLLALTLLKPPADFGADVVVGNSQRFGVPLGFGGPHAAFMATRDEHKRRLPGRLVGVSHDSEGKPAYRLALQTREQHIRREKATSNICTAQVLLAVMASMYAVYHGPDGLKAIARRVHRLTRTLRTGLTQLGFDSGTAPVFDTLRVKLPEGAIDAVMARATTERLNLRRYQDRSIGIALDETTDLNDLETLWRVVSGQAELPFRSDEVFQSESAQVTPLLARSSAFLTHPVFNTHHSETEMQRYLRRLEARDLSLTTSMIPLGSCTMKLNAAAEMFPVSWPEVSQMHPFAPPAQTEGYRTMIADLESWLAEITGFAAVSVQPNAGSQGEYAGLLVIRKYHGKRGQGHRDICLIPQSAHGTNPASAVMAGLKVVVVACDAQGNVDLNDLRRLAEQHSNQLAALMVTYPSTHGVFEEDIKEICNIVHQHGGQVYMDGANMNAQVGVCRPGDFGPDVCHLNLHKTFCIPHGGGGPGVGPIGVASHLVPFLPGSRFCGLGGDDSVGAISAAPYGSASILPIPWMYITMMGASGLRRATLIAILNANYIARRLNAFYPVLYKGREGLVAHECILDMRNLKEGTDIGVEDVAKRLMDYGFHAPTMSFPVAGTLMVEPTESESKQELDRFCEAMISIHGEVAEIRSGVADVKVNLLKMAPHTAATLTADVWDRPYSRERAAFPSPSTRQHKYWPPVARIDNAFGDRHLICSCPPIDSFQ